MVETKNNKFKIIQYIIFIAKCLFQAICLSFHYLWRFILTLDRKIRTKSDVKENELPLISEDNSEISEDEDTVVDENNTFPQQVAIPATSEGTELRKRSVVKSADMPDYCQVCGIKSAMICCQGPRCYKFFCFNCDTLYHQHPRRESHIRRDIPIVKTPSSEEVENSFANKKQKNTSEVVAQTPSLKNVHKDLVSAQDETLDEMASSSTSWICTFCTISNERSFTICKMCSKTNAKIMLLTEIAQEVLNDESLKQPLNKTPTQFNETPTKLTKRSTNEENANHNDSLYFWTKSNNSSESNSQPPPENGTNLDVSKSYQSNRSTRGRSNNIHPQNTATKSKDENNTNITLRKEMDEECIASGITKTSSETCPPIDDRSLIWKCRHCTFENDSTVNTCEICSKTNIIKSVNEDNKTEMSQSKNISKEDQRSDSANCSNADVASCSSDTDVVALLFMERHSLDNYEIAKLASMLVNRNYRLEDAIEAAKNCSNLEECLAYLEQDCQICQTKFSKREMIQMLYCTHQLCKNCTRRYFTKQIRTNDITSFVCPFCKAPNQQRIEVFDDSISEYYSNLSDLLKPILDFEEFEMFQKKLRDWFLNMIPNFKQCPHCPYGGLVDDTQKWMACPECNLSTCLQCKRSWYPNHEGKSCEQLAALEEAPKSKKSNKKNDKPQEKNSKGFLSMFKGSPKKSDQEPVPEQIKDSYSSVANSSKAAKYTQNQEDAHRHDNNNYKYKSSAYPSLTQPQSQENTPTRPNYNPGNNASTGAISKIKNDHASSSNNTETRTMGNNATTEGNFTVSQEGIVSEDISDVPTQKWDCRYCTRTNDAFVKICASCGKSYSINFDSKRVKDLKLHSPQLENIHSNSNTVFENLARVHNLNKTTYNSTELESSIQGFSISSDKPSTVNAPIGSAAIPAQTPMDWQESPDFATRLYEKRGDELTKNWDLRKEAIHNGFSLDELEIAIFNCNDTNPIQWLKKQWQIEITYVKLTAARELSQFGDINFRNIPPVTDIQAKNALKKSFGNCTKAVRECVENSLTKFKEIQLIGELSQNENRILSETNRSSVDAWPSTYQTIYPNVAMVPASTTYNPPPTNQRIYSHQELRNAAFSTTNNTNYASFVQSQFTRVDSAVERSANILRQSVGHTTIQNPTAISNISPGQYHNVNPSFSTSTRPDGVHLAKPSIADYKQ